MITAQECFNETIKKLDTIDTIDDLLEIEKNIKQVMSEGRFAFRSKPLKLQVAEKLAIELEEFGFYTFVEYANVINENKEPLFFILINWRQKPVSTSRVEQPASYN